MNFLSKYINNISALQFNQLLRFASMFLVGIVFSRFYSKTSIGEYETIILVVGAVSYFWLKGVLQSFLSILKPSTETEKSADYFNAFLLMLAFTTLAILVLFIFKNLMAQFLVHKESLPYFNYLVLFLAFSIPSFLIEYIYLGQTKPKAMLGYGIVSYSTYFLVLILPPFLNKPIELAIAGLVLVNLLRFIFLLYLLFKFSKIQPSWSFIKQHLTLATPIIGSALIGGSAQYIDSVIVTNFFDSATFAIFRYGARELPLAFIMANALSNSMIPEFNKLGAQEALQKLKRNADRLTHFLFPLTILMLLTSNLIYPLVFTKEFAFSAKVFNVYLLLLIPRLLFPQTILIANRKTKPLFWVALTEMVLNIAFSLLFIRMFGLIGIAFATIVAFSVDKLLYVIIVKKQFGYKLSDYLSLKWFSIYSALTIAVYIFVDFIWF